VNNRIVVLALGAAMLAAGCSSGSSDHSGSPVTVHTPKPHTHTAVPTDTVTPTPTVTVTAPTSVPRCLSSQLSLSLGAGQGAAGSTYRPIVFTNTGSQTCELHGYPGVSFVDASGAQLGTPAREDPGKQRTVKLPSGGAANALLQEPDPGVFAAADCQATKANRLRVYPPGEKTPLFISDTERICTTKAGRTGVQPVEFGNGG
jgi:hypothetical protein